MSDSRTKNVIRNSWVSLSVQVIDTLIAFVSRTVFIHFLGVEYLGVNGLFVNVLKILSFAELGIGNAIIYHLYKPIATDDREKIKSLMLLYAKAYKVIAVVVFLIGLVLIPFMDLIIKDKPNIKENIILIYMLFLINSTISYLFVYKKSIILANQKKYIVSLYQQSFHILQVAGQVLILIFTQEFMLYLLVLVASTLFNNIMISRKANTLYPFLKDRNVKELDKVERKNIFKNVKALFIYKFGSVVLNGTDNIIISAIIGIASVGLVSNYILIIGTISTILAQVMSSFTASIGNLIAVGNQGQKERVFDKIFFLNAWIYGFSSIGILLLINPLITLWIGDKFLLDEIVVFSIILHYYIDHMHFAAYNYRITTGLFVQGKIAPFVASVINITLSIWLGKKIGLAGIFFATSMSRLATTNIIDPILIYTKIFKKNPIIYYAKYYTITFVIISLYFTIDFFTSHITIPGYCGFVIKLLAITVLFNGLMVVIFRKSRNYIELKATFLKNIKF